MSFDIHKFSQETFWGYVILGAIFLFGGIALAAVIRPWWAGCVTLILISSMAIYGFFAHYDPEAIKPPSQKAFSVRAKFAFFPQPNERFSSFYFDNGPPILYPISVGLFLQLTNSGDRTFMVDSWFADFQSNGRDWIPMRYLPVTDRVLLAKNLSQTAVFLFSWNSNFDYVRKNRNIAPGDTIQGWAFFDVETTVPIHNIRLRITDMTNWNSVEVIDLPVIQSGEEDILFSGDRLDRSSWPIKLFPAATMPSAPPTQQ